MEMRLATVHDRPAVVETVVAAFDEDPAFRAFFGDNDEFGELARRFAGYLFDRRVHRSSAWVGHDGGVAALWDRPDVPSSVSGDHAGLTLDLGAEVQARLDEYDAAVHQALPDVPHWYLGILATHPERRGGGLGRRLAELGLAQALADRVPAFLETTNADNVRIYERTGWTVHAELADVLGLRVWVMRHAGLVAGSVDHRPVRPGNAPSSTPGTEPWRPSSTARRRSPGRPRSQRP